MHRRVLRLVLVGPAGARGLGALAVDAPRAVRRGSAPAPTGPGVAVAVWGPVRCRMLAGAALPVMWFALDNAVGDAGAIADVLGWWRTDPLPMLALAVPACALGRQR